MYKLDILSVNAYSTDGSFWAYVNVAVFLNVSVSWCQSGGGACDPVAHFLLFRTFRVHVGV